MSALNFRYLILVHRAFFYSVFLIQLRLTNHFFYLVNCLTTVSTHYCKHVYGLFSDFQYSSSNMWLKFVFGLLKGHWQSSNTSKEVLSTVLHILRQNKLNTVNSASKCFGIHAFMLQDRIRVAVYLVAVTGYYSETPLSFLVIYNTSNICDGSFGYAERRFHSTDVMNPK